MTEARGPNTAMSMGEIILRIIPSLLLFLTLIYCCCKGEGPTRGLGSESSESRTERRAHLESLLIVKNVIAAPKKRHGLAHTLTSSDRAYSSFLSAVRVPSRGADVKFSQDKVTASLQQAEQGSSHVQCTESTHEHTTTTTSSTPATHVVVPSTTATAQEPSDDGDERTNTAAYARSSHADKDASIRTSNRTNVSWIPSESSSSRQESTESPRPRRKSNIFARTLSMSFRSIYSHSNDFPTSCDICLMDYEVGEEVCWSPNEECTHAFHKDCMLDWLLRNPKCPVCRRDYVTIETRST